MSEYDINLHKRNYFIDRFSREISGLSRVAVERAEARSATMADSEKNCDFGHARGDIAEQVVGFR